MAPRHNRGSFRRLVRAGGSAAFRFGAAHFGVRTIGRFTRRPRRARRSRAVRALLMQQDKRRHEVSTGVGDMGVVWGIFNFFTTLDQGDLSINRESNRIYLKELEWEGRIRGLGTITIPRRVRVYLVKQNFTENANPLFSDLMDDNNVNSLRIGSLNPGKGRISVLKSWDFFIQPSAITDLTSGAGSMKILRFHKHFKTPIEVRFSGSGTGTQAKGSICLMSCTELGAVVPTLSHEFRANFIA